MQKLTVAFIPARGGSKGIKRKNLMKMGNETLVEIAIKSAIDSKIFNFILVNSEDEEIRNLVKSKFLGVDKVIIQDRPEEYWHDNTVQEVDRLIEWSIKKFENDQNIIVDEVALLYATAPLRKAVDIKEAYNIFKTNRFDSLLSVTESREYLWRIGPNNSIVGPINYSPFTRGPNQLEGWNQWRENKSVYIFKKNLLKEGARIGGKVGFYKMDKISSIDVDTTDDLELVRHIYETRKNS
ncbi:acylneuraminate cytidylyltransferase family protein [Candidatus Pelagibacter sp. HIMB1695]|uniref:acylneuraminate cytidylyltransferase family protein n=1 Tax=Candidatus Pelagibacter sp. HIMB1695 TaxID=3413364 RepID=UPI003F8475CD